MSPHLPYEYTEEGILQRLNAYLNHQDFCSPFPEHWPRDEAVTTLVSPTGRSCKETCMEESESISVSYLYSAVTHPQW